MAQQYHYQLDTEHIENLVSVFADFADDVRHSINSLQITANTEARLRRERRRRANVAVRLNQFFQRRPPREILEEKQIVIDLEVMEQRLKEKEEHKNVLSKLVYEHCVLQV